MAHESLRSSAARRNSISVLSRWRQIKEGTRHVALISGEPGIGKSRLVLALRERLQKESRYHSATVAPRITSTARSSPSSRSWSGRRDLRRMTLGISVSINLHLLRETADTPNNAVALFADLLGIPIGSRYQLASMSSLQKKGLPSGHF